MATTTASLTITSSDLVGDALSLTTTNQLNKAGTATGLEQTTGIATAYLTELEQQLLMLANHLGFIFVINQQMKRNTLR
jgi:hypothetical protein